MTIVDIIHEKFLSWVNGLTVVKVAVLLILIWITIFRKRLSSNDEYRGKKTAEKQAYCKVSPVVDRTIDVGKEKIAFSRLSSDVTINIVSYLNNHDISSLMSTSKKMYTELSVDCIWEQLWMQSYGAMWQHPEIRKIREGRGIFWDPMLNYGPPQQGWYRFFLLFEVSWLDWILAGYCNHARCLVGIQNMVVDVTKFIDTHPGSPETLTEAAGCEATELFTEIGHSSQAENLMKSMAIWDSNTSNISACLCDDIHLQQNLCGHCLQLSRVKKNAKCQPILMHQQRSFPTRSKLHDHMNENKKKVAELAWRKHQEAAANANAANQGHELNFDSFAAVIPLLDAVHNGTNSVVNAVHNGTSSVVTAVHTTTSNAIANTNNAILNNALLNNSVLHGVIEIGDEEVDFNDTDSADTDSDSDYSDSDASENTRENNNHDDGEDNEGDGLPEVADGGFSKVIFSPSKTLSGILDKISKEYRRAGSIQRSGLHRHAQAHALHPRSPTTITSADDTNTGAEAGSGMTTDAEDEPVLPPARLDSYFGPSQLMVPDLPGFAVCLEPQDHLGQPKAFFDPFTEEWTVWWSCCGQGQVLIEAPLPVTHSSTTSTVREHAADVIFCK